MFKLNKDYATQRKQIWIAAWMTVASSPYATSREVATAWADKCLRDFDKRFLGEQPTDNVKSETIFDDED